MIVINKIVDDMEELSSKADNKYVSSTYNNVSKLTDEYEEIILDNLTQATLNMLETQNICKDVRIDSEFANQIREQIKMRIGCPELNSEDFHNLWLEDMKEKGYVRGDVFSKRNLTHPNVVEYKCLNKNIHIKDKIIDNLVDAFI